MEREALAERYRGWRACLAFVLLTAGRGHQAGLRFATDSTCGDCYDGGSAQSREHFFAEKHWSDEALAIMKRVLPHAR